MLNKLKFSNINQDEDVEKSVAKLLLADDLYQKNLQIPSSENLVSSQNFIFNAITTKPSNLFSLLDCLSALENLYQQVANKSSLPTSQYELKLQTYSNDFNLIRSHLIDKQSALLLPVVEEKLEKAKEALGVGNVHYAYILLQSVEKFEKMLKKN